MSGTLRDVAYTDEMNAVLGMTTRWVAEAIKSQFDVAMGGELLTHDAAPLSSSVVYRKTCGNPFVIPYGAIETRWFGRSRCSLEHLTEIPESFVAKIFKAKGGNSTTATALSEPEKYRRAQQTFARIGSELARLDDGEFETALEELDRWWYNLRQGAGVAVPTGEEDEHVHNHEDDDQHGERETENLPLKGDSVPVALVPMIRLSGKVRRAGRPNLNRVQVKEKSRVAHKEYNQGMRLRVLLRGSDVCDVVTTLREIRPGVSKVGSYLATHEVKTSASKRTPTWSIEDNFVPSRVRFRLPEEVISNALNFLKTEIRDGDTEIELGSDRERTDDTNGYVVTFERLGQFTREQLEAMQWLWNLQSACREAMLCCTWLTRSVKEVEDGTSPAHVAFLQILECWPYAALKGFGFDLSYAAIFCLRDSQWLNDTVMRAVAVSLSRFKNNQTVMLPPPTSDGQRGDILQEKAIRSIARAVASRPFVLMPVNLGGVRWAGLP
ncbi:hypothetical protein F441_17534 [Phytophthora nicotianae CJ01A1]|uniref:Uncharacterized protein n=1 Tax=Phytophthora nicotianae CJ01A1 TaxID=1317063 RepID=W2W6A7_PHYNI|nr:hypothetical protein F441_17534 [Phytophthora nicotianae CJ01A1]